MPVDRTTEALVIVRRCRNEQEAAIVVMCLRDAGIPAHVDGGLTSAMRTEVAADVGVRIFESDLQRALEVLPPERAHSTESLDDTEDEPFDEAQGESSDEDLDEPFDLTEDKPFDEAQSEATENSRGNWLIVLNAFLLTLVVLWILLKLLGVSVSLE